MPTHTRPRARACSHPLPWLVLALVLAIGGAHPASADDTIRVPDVEQQDVEAAIETLEKAGLDVRVIEVAGPAVDVVFAQDPPAGVTMRRGGIVTIRIGIKARIETRMPDVAGKRIEDALDQLAAAYDVMIVPVPAGSRDRPGHVVRTEPVAGAKVWFRSPVTLFLAERPEDLRPRGEPPAPPPSDAPPVPDVPPPPVPAPPTGAGAPADLAPPGAAPTPLPAEAGSMPSLVGRTYAEAQRLVRRAGLVPHPWFFRSDGTPFEVYAQKVQAGAPVAPGSLGHFRVILPQALPARVPTPDVAGLGVGAAIRVARDLGLTIRIRGTKDVTAPDATVLEQVPAPGGEVDAGAALTLVVGDAPAPVPAAGPAPGTPAPTPPPAFAGRLTPGVVGMTVPEAKAALARAGLEAQVVPTAAPEAAPDRVFEQEPPAGLPVEGTLVRLMLPEPSSAPIDPKQLYAKVPDVVDRPLAQAEATVNATGLRAVVERGPEIAGAPVIVIAQSHHPGALIQMGTLVTLVTGAPDGASGTTVAPAPQKDDRNAVEKVGRFFRKKHKQAWGKIKDLFK